jgi:hypothetical protein
MNNSVLLILATLAVVALIDYVPRAFLLAKKAIPVRTSRKRKPDFLIMPTVYGDISYLKNISFLKQYAKNVVICTSKYETEKFYKDLRAVCRSYGFRYIRVDLPFTKNKPIKNAYTIYKGVFNSINRLKAKNKTPCILIDADTYSLQNVNNLVCTFEEHNLSIASLRCEVSKPTTLLEYLQEYEYRLAMDNRRMDPWLTSGACNIGRAEIFRHVFSRHSHFFAGGDVEIGKLAKIMGYKVGHIDFTFFTEVPSTFKDWFNQRIIWFAGGVRHHVAGMGSFGWHHFFLFFYNSLLIYLLFPLRWIEILNFPATMVVLIVLSWIYVALLNAGKKWRAQYLLLPFYAFMQSMIILPIAFVRYFKYAWIQRSFGILNHDLSRFNFGSRVTFKLLNYSSVAIVVYAAVVFTISRVHYWEQHGALMKLIAKLV